MTLPLGTDIGNRTVADPDNPFTLEPDRAFLGCLMQTSIRQARSLLAGVRPDDARSFIAQQVLSLVIRLVVEGIKPDPLVLLSEARNQGWLASEYRHKQFAEWLIDTFRAAPVPEAAFVLKRDLLEAVLRRTLTEQATRVLDVAAHGRIERLRELATLDTDRIADLWHRYDETARRIAPANPETAVTDQTSAPSDRLSPPPHDAVTATRTPWQVSRRPTQRPQTVTAPLGITPHDQSPPCTPSDRLQGTA